MKRTLLFLVLCTVTFAPAKAAWSLAYWYSPPDLKWSELKMYFQVGNSEGKDGGSAIYIGGEGYLPNSNEDNTVNIPFKAMDNFTFCYFHNDLPWRSRSGLVVPVPARAGNHKYTVLTVDEGIIHLGNWWFKGLGDLQEVSLPSTLESIGEGAFMGCKKLPEINIPDKVWFIDSRAFRDCGELKHIKIPANAALFDEVFRGSGLESVDLKGTVRLLGKYVFQDCENFKHFTVSAGSTLGDCALAKSSLETVTVNDNVSFGNCAFQDCTNLKSVTFRGGINAVTEGMFQDCSSLTSVNIPNGVTSIGANAFNASGIISINIPNSVTSIGEYAFNNTGKITSVTIPNSVTKLGECAFKQTGLTSITVPGSVKDIPYAMCVFCENLTSVKLCEGVKFIGDAAFQTCGNLETVSLPASLDSIDGWAFGFCNNLKVIECNSMTPPAVHSNAFIDSDLTNTSLCVPRGSVDAYRNAPVWKNFKNIGTYPAGIHIINGKNFTVNSGSKIKLTARLTPHDAVPAIVWTSSNKSIASAVDGVVSAYAPGEAIITATTINGIFKDSCRITVTLGKNGLVIPEEDIIRVIPDKDIIRDWKNSKHITIPANCILEDGIFANHSTLETVTVGDNVNFGKDAFHGCKNLKSVTFQGRISEVTEGMFRVCTGLSSVNIPGGVTSIGDFAFDGCRNLQTVSIPNSVTSIGDYAFANCYGLQTVSIPNSVTSIGDGAFFLSMLTSVTIPNSVTRIGTTAFQQSGLKSITVPGSVKEIGAGAFVFCHALTSVKICEGVKTILYEAFEGCENLEKISLPASLEYMDQYVFTWCNNIKVIECSSTIPPNMSSYVFDESDITNVTVYVPYGSVDAYRNAKIWKNFPSIVALSGR